MQSCFKARIKFSLRWPQLFMLLLFSVSAGGCGLKQFRTDSGQPCLDDATLTRCNSADLVRGAGEFGQPDSGYLMGVVELDDQGDLWSPEQTRSLLKRIERETENQEVLTVIFAHGWFHNASATDENFRLISQLLSYLQEKERDYSKSGRSSGRAPRQVVGLFLGWRGESIPLPGLKYLSFWGRKKAAEKVGRAGALEVILPLEDMVKEKQDSQLIIIGHSFGGALIYSALSNIVVERQYDRGRGGVADLTILLNPALEAQKFASARRVLREVRDVRPTKSARVLSNMEPIDSNEPPREIIVIASKGDVPVGSFFPIGQSVTSIFEGHRPGQWQSTTRAIGHYPPYTTHELFPVGEPFEPADICVDRRTWSSILAAPPPSIDSENSCEQGELIGNRFCLQPNQNYAQEILKVVSTDRAIVNGHSDICNPNLVAFMYELIKKRTQPEAGGW